MDGKQLLEEIARNHFQSGSEQPLVRSVYDLIDDEDPFDMFRIDNTLVRRAITKKIRKQIADPDFIEKIIEGLQAEPMVREGILTALSYVQLMENPVLYPHIERNLRHDSKEVRESASTVIAYQYPDKAQVIARFLRPEDYNMAIIACYSENPKLIFPLLKFFNFPERRVRTTIGYLVNPYWLAQNYDNDRETVSTLMEEFGYVNSDITGLTLELLSQGFRFVSQEMLESPKPAEWQRRIGQIQWNLMPNASEMGVQPVSIDLDDPIDTSLFLGAVRESDISNLKEKKKQDPFSYRNETLGTLTCAHSPYRYFKRRIIDEGIVLGRVLGVKDVGQFLVEYACVFLETDKEEHNEAEIMLRSKWNALSKVFGFSTTPSTFPVKEDKDFPLLKFAFISPKRSPGNDMRLSAGANSAVRLADYLDMSGIADKLAELETIYSSLLPVGCEVQYQTSDKNTIKGRRMALTFFGINCPYRTEYETMTEIAFRPSKTFHSFALGAMLLNRIGFFDSEQDAGYHISIQGDLGDDTRYIICPRLFINGPSRIFVPENKDELFRKRARLMSKGYACVHDESMEPCFDGDSPKERTEMRVYHFFTDMVDEEMRIRTTFIDDLVSTQLLASASQSTELRAIWEEYAREIREYMQKLGPEFVKLLDSDWYQATGDPRDGNLVHLLPIVHQRDLANSIVNEKGLRDRVENDIKQIIGKYTRMVHDKIVGSASFNFSSMPVCSYGVPFFMPKGLNMIGSHIK